MLSQKPPQVSIDKEQKGLRIVVIEDCEEELAEWRTLLETVIEKHPTFYITTYTDAEKALQSIEEENHVAMVISDSCLLNSSMKGIAIYKKLHYNLKKDFPFLLVSNNAKELSDVMDSRVNTLLKPFDKKEVIRMVSKVLQDNLHKIRWNSLTEELLSIKKDQILLHTKMDKTENSLTEIKHMLVNHVTEEKASFKQLLDKKQNEGIMRNIAKFIRLIFTGK